MKRFFEVPVKAAKRGVDVRLTLAQLPQHRDTYLAIPSRRVTTASQLADAVQETRKGRKPAVTSISWSAFTIDRKLRINGQRALEFLAKHTGRQKEAVDPDTGRSLEGDIRLGVQLIGNLKDGDQLDAIQALGFAVKPEEVHWDPDDPAAFFDRTLTAGLAFVEGFTNEEPHHNLLEYMLPWARTPHVVSYLCQHFRVTARLNPHLLFQHASLKSDVWSYEEKSGNDWNEEDDLRAVQEGFNSGLVEYYREFDCIPKRVKK